MSDAAFDVTVRIAALLLSSSGEGVGMLERYVARIARSYRIKVGVLVLPEQVLLTDLTTATTTPVAVVRSAPGLSRLDQVAELKVLVSDIEAGLSPEDALRRVDQLATSRPRWPAWLRVIGVVLFAAGFAPSVVASWSEVAATGILGAVMGVLLVTFERRRFEPLLPFVGAFTLTVIAATLPLFVVVLAWIPFTIGLVLAFNGNPSMVAWLVPTVIGTYLLQQAITRLAGDVTGTLIAGIALGAVANLLAAPNHRPPRLILVVGGFFVLTVGGLGLRGVTALVGNDILSGFDDLRDFLLQVPTVAIALAIGMLLTRPRPRDFRSFA